MEDEILDKKKMIQYFKEEITQHKNKKQYEV